MPWEKQQYCNDLIKFVEVINRYDDIGCIGNGVGGLYAIENQYRYSDSTELRISGITLTIRKKIAGTRPLDVEALNIYIDCSFDIDMTLDVDVYDPIKMYDLQLMIVGDVGGEEYLNCWHLDKDIPPKEGDSHKNTHPSYHFQAGGNRLEGKNIGQLLQLGAPRLPHPPMDIFLAIHFVINNFFNKNDYPFIENLFNDLDYIDILDRARNRMFVPYFKSFKDNCRHQDFTIGKVFPLAV
ncbi:hypothetical protein [Acinetobacter schindleri]|uniref:hypothetical protein n=1 Tax=Acinetobacter schindleri TaxID=108981 RepID=UPI002899DE21|nr:hypothetical protein [Acinetobacter schindleri]